MVMGESNDALACDGVPRTIANSHQELVNGAFIKLSQSAQILVQTAGR
jgi:hypothetical protein